MQEYWNQWWMDYGLSLEAFLLKYWEEYPELLLGLLFFLLVFFLFFSLRRKKSPPGEKKLLREKEEELGKQRVKEESLQREEVPWKAALQKSRTPFLGKLQRVWDSLRGQEHWDEEHPLWESLEEALLGSDMGPQLSTELLQALQQEFRERRPSLEKLQEKLREYLYAIFERIENKEHSIAGPKVTVLIGVNGAGKTTTAGKLAYQAKQKGKTVLLGAGDTFRAAAVEQLKAWADRIGVDCILPAKGANPAAVAFDAVTAGLARNMEEVIIDTAGRLHTNESLMEELAKLGRVVRKKISEAPHETLLVLDATLGQNALIQAREFCKALPATGVVLSKLDGSSKGGVIFSIILELGIPVKMVGMGEKPEDLRLFSSREFVNNLMNLPT